MINTRYECIPYAIQYTIDTLHTRLRFVTANTRDMLITARDDGFNGGVNDDDDINDETVKKKKIQQPKNPKAIFDRNSKLLGAYSILLLSVQARPVNCNYFHSPRNLFNCTNFQRKKKYILN